jgi:methyl-accepting chemotaxis protein
VIGKDTIEALEAQANAAAQSLASLMASLNNSLHSVSSTSLEGICILHTSVDNTSTAVTDTITQMQNFLNKCQQLNHDMKACEELSKQIKEIRRTLDIMEPLINKFGRNG